MSNSQGSETRRLSKAVSMRLAPEEHARLLAEAEAAGLNLAELTRRLFGLRIVSRSDAALIRELRRLGGLLKLALTAPGPPGQRADARLALRAIGRAIDALAGPPP